jgi:hypothetical protein
MSRAELYQKLLKQASKELRCKVTDERAKNYAVLKLAREVISSKLVSGRDIDPSALRWLSEELEKYAPAAMPPSVQLTIQPVTLCAKCRSEVEGEPPPPLPPVAVPIPPPLVAVEANSAADPTLPITRKPLAAADNVVELALDKFKARRIHGPEP